MRKFYNVLSIILFSIFFYVIGLNSVLAADTCGYKEKNALNKIAGKVQANYEIITADDGKQSIAINVFNIPNEDIYVNVFADGYPSDTTESTTMLIYYNMTNNGSYQFLVNDIDHIVKYTIRVQSYSCSNFVRTFSIIKPKKNKFSDMDACKYQEVLDYFFCKEWITEEIKYDDKTVLDKIEKARIAKTTTTTTRCYSCELEEKEAKKLAEFNQLKTYLIIGISAGILIDILVIVVLLVRIKRYSL